MADPTVLDPSSYDHFPQIGPSNPSFSDTFDSHQFPDDFPSDLTLSPGFLPDLYFDEDLDFDMEDLLNLPEIEEEFPLDEGRVPSSSSSPHSGSQEGSGVSSSSPLSGNGSSRLSGNINMPSPDSGNSASSSPETGSSEAGAAGGEVKSEVEEDEKKGVDLKRKKEWEDGNGNPNPNPRTSKVRRSSPSDEGQSVGMFNSGSKEEDKRTARLMRNRESAQLSRQRKKHYVGELEEKVKALHSTIADLNNKISFFMSENASLRQQLGGRGRSCPPPTVYPPPPLMAPVHFPWTPCSSYALRPQASQVPLIPIPRLKSQQPAPAPKGKKSEGKKSDSKTKKVASVSLLGLLFFVLLVGGIGPGVNHLRYGGSREAFSGYGYAKDGFFDKSRGRVLTVSENLSRFNQTEETGICSGKMGFGKSSLDRVNGKNCGSGMAISEVKQKEQESRPSPGSEGTFSTGNASEPLLASLYVPRNDKLVKIDGNLIIHSVLASERAVAHLASGAKSDKGKQSLGKERKETGLAILSSTSALSKSGGDIERRSHMYRSPGEHKKALAAGSKDTYKNKLKSTPAEGLLQQWFREGLEGSILSSGMCTEVFQFEVSPASANSGGIIPATSIANVTNKHPSGSARPGKMNRRILHAQAIPLPAATVNNTEGRFGEPTENRSIHTSKSVSSIVVSVLVDPREAGDGNGDGMMAPKAISRIFVVVLLDSVKYVTYSCGLPLKSSVPHLVTG